MSIAVTDFLTRDQKVNPSGMGPLKNLMFYIHQNFLILVDFILHRLPSQCSENVLFLSLNISCGQDLLQTLSLIKEQERLEREKQH